MSIKNITITLLLMFFLIPSITEGSIYVCIDGNGARHYSDKKCPISNKFKTEVINDFGKAAFPDSVLEFSPIIQIMKRTLALAAEQMPDKELYRKAYQYTLDAEVGHLRYMSTTHKEVSNNYNPFDPVKLVDIIAAISDSCRSHGYMSICGAIEGNYWLSGEEQRFLKNAQNKPLSSPSNQKKFCEKAKIANQGGLISRRMLGSFCLNTNK
ncbi:MAG: DUF4124 domain-containing protein [Gammaproteobacteria bacterium]|nr:DUF4124 domain-containing protein [Gammaproteobacteria bacterium]